MVGMGGPQDLLLSALVLPLAALGDGLQRASCCLQREQIIVVADNGWWELRGGLDQSCPWLHEP